MLVAPAASFPSVTALRLVELVVPDGLPQPATKNNATYKGIPHRTPVRRHRTSLCRLLTSTLSRIISKGRADHHFCDAQLKIVLYIIYLYDYSAGQH